MAWNCKFLGLQLVQFPIFRHPRCSRVLFDHPGDQGEPQRHGNEATVSETLGTGSTFPLKTGRKIMPTLPETAWNPETRQLESKLTLTIYCGLWMMFFLKGDSLIITKRSKSISTFRRTKQDVWPTALPLAVTPWGLNGRSGPDALRCWKWWIEPPVRHGHFFRDQWRDQWKILHCTVL